MTRSIFALLCFSLIFSAASAADPAPPSPTDTYIVARDRYIAEHMGHLGFKGHFEGSDDPRSVQEFENVDRLLRAAVPAWTMPGFSQTGAVNLSAYDDPYRQGFGVLNGLIYTAGETWVIVTNRALLANHLDPSAGASRTPVAMLGAVFREESFWSSAVASSGVAFLHGAVPVTAPEGADSVAVSLAGFHNGLDYDATPDQLVAAVVRKDRVWIATERLKQPLAPLTACVKAYERGTNEFPWAPTVQESARLHGKAAARAVKSYLACFARHLHKQPNYAAIQKQAQHLVDHLK